MEGVLIVTDCKICETVATRRCGFLTILIIISFLALPAMAYAEKITYTGKGDALRSSPSWFFGEEIDFCLFPGTKAAPLRSGNKVTINYDTSASGVMNPNSVFGGLGKTENAGNNEVVLQNGQVDDYISGGVSESGNALDNAVVILGGSVGSSVLGGWGKNGDVSGNTVTISGGAVRNNVLGGSSENGSTAGNRVTISGGSVNKNVFGGFSVTGNASGNTVTFNRGLVGKKFFGGYSESGIVSGNTITINGGSVGDGGYGGYCYDGVVANNTVIINGGSIEGFVLGGFCYDGSATGNIVTISGRPELAEAHIVGGHTENSQEDAFTGNTLELKSSGISVKTVHNFEYYNFYLSESLTTDEVMLNVSGIVYLDETTVTISMKNNSKLQKGDKVILIHTDWGFNLSPKNKSCQVQHDGLLYEFSIYKDFYNLWAKLEKVSGTTK